MTVRRRRLPNFESCSVALFASLAVGGATLPSRAQVAAPSARSVASSNPSPFRAWLRLAPPGRESPDRPRAADTPTVVPDGSISSPGFDESLK